MNVEIRDLVIRRSLMVRMEPPVQLVGTKEFPSTNVAQTKRRYVRISQMLWSNDVIYCVACQFLFHDQLRWNECAREEGEGTKF